jgi:hypothetical protein
VRLAIRSDCNQNPAIDQPTLSFRRVALQHE